MNKNRLIHHTKSLISRNKSSTAGFTILELMIASAVFAVVLLILAIGAISFTNSYYSGITSSEVQTVARAIMSEVSQSVEFSENVTTLPQSGAVSGYCIDNTMYSYELGLEVVSSPTTSQDQNYHGLVVDNNSSCSTNPTPSLPQTPNLPSSQHELLNQHMRLTAFDITQLAGNLYTIHLKVVYADNAILVPPLPGGLGAGYASQWDSMRCAPGVGSQFCAISDLTTSVEQRLN